PAAGVEPSGSGPIGGPANTHCPEMKNPLQCAARTLVLSAPLVMGVLNVTPDSFSDGGRFVGRDDALRQAEAMWRAGAAIIDVGGESTRPGAAPVAAQQELDRELPVVEASAAQLGGAISLDTCTEEVL